MFALVVLCALAPTLSAAAPAVPADSATSIFAGVAARSPALDARAERAAIALGQALERRGVVDAGSPPLPDPADGPDSILDGLVTTARTLYLDGDFTAALAKADGAVERFEGSGAFRMGATWSSYADALVLRALALRRLGKESDADAALTRLASVMPDATPDPEITPPKIAQRHEQILVELRGKPRVQIEVVSEPAGAGVLVDGKPAGETPVVVRDLLPGVHFVALSFEGERVERTVTGTSGTVRVGERVGDARTAAARSLRRTVSTPATRGSLLERAHATGDDVIIGAMEPWEGGALLVLARIVSSDLAVAGVFLEEGDPVNAKAQELAEALLGGKRGWVGDLGRLGKADPPPPTPEDVLLGPGKASRLDEAAGAPEGDEDGGGTWLLVGVGAGAVAAVATAVAVGAFLAAGAANELEVTVDASNL